MLNLGVTHLTGFNAGQAAARIEYLATLTAAGTDLTGSVSLGAAASDRYILACVGGTSASHMIPTPALDGVTMTHLASCPATVLGCADIFGLLVPTGSSATFDADFAVSPTYSGCLIHAAYGLQSTTPKSTFSIGDGSSTAAAINFSTGDVPVDGFGLFYTNGWPNSSQSVTWSGTLGVTELADLPAGGTNVTRQSSAKFEGFGSGTIISTLSAAYIGGRRGGAGIIMR